MADYCKECSDFLFGRDFKELAGLSTEADTEKEEYVAVLCEGCGTILVDHTGYRVTEPQYIIETGKPNTKYKDNEWVKRTIT